MDTSEDTVRIYTGPTLVANALVGRLKEHNITAIERKDQQDAHMFGQGSNYTEQIRLFVRPDELSVAQPIVDAFIAETE